MEQRILVAADNTVLRADLTEYLGCHCYEVLAAEDGLATFETALCEMPDLIILAFELPEMESLEVCRLLRQASMTITTPLIILSARGEELDKVVGLELGADDYLTQPFSKRELLARVRALLRQRRICYSAATSPGQESSRTISVSERDLVAGSLRIDLMRHCVTYREREVTLRSQDFDLLTCLVRHPGTVLTRPQLIEHIGGKERITQIRTIDNNILRLRRKLEQDPTHPRLIETVRGIGYRFLAEEASCWPG